MTVSVLWLFIDVPWVDLQRVIVVFPKYTHFFFVIFSITYLVSTPIARAMNFTKDFKNEWITCLKNYVCFTRLYGFKVDLE